MYIYIHLFLLFSSKYMILKTNNNTILKAHAIFLVSPLKKVNFHYRNIKKKNCSVLKNGVVLKNTRILFVAIGRSYNSVGQRQKGDLTTEAVEGSALALEGIDDIEGGDGLALGMLSVGDGITDDIFEEHLEDTAGLFVDETRDTFNTSTACQTADCRLGDALDVIP